MSAASSRAQVTPVGSVEQTPDSYTETVPTTCPSRLRSGFLGWVFGIPYANHRWTAEWVRIQVLEPVHSSKARYHPYSYDGYAERKGAYIASEWGGSARWYMPEIDNECTAEDHYYLRRWIGRDEYYIPYAYHGSVEECAGGGASVRVEADAWSDPDYDPFDSGEGTVAPEADGCGGGGGGGEDTQPDPDDPDGPHGWVTPTPGGGGTYFCPDSMPYYWDIGCVQEWKEGVGWVDWWCGPILVCG